MSTEAHSVLIVEDHVDSRELLAEFLEALGYEVSMAGHGQEALELLRGGLRPSVVLLDLMMPVMSGWELMEHVRADEDLCTLRVVVVSGAGAAQPLPRGICGAVPKPVDLDALRAAVEDATRHGAAPVGAGTA
jgi:CheY-like chemotaxis protein